MKISDFAMLPHDSLSVSWAEIRPMKVAPAGTTRIHIRLLKTLSRNSLSLSSAT